MKTLRKILSPLFDFIFAIKVKYNLLNKDELINLKFSILDDDYFFCELLQNTLIQAGASEDNVSTFTDEFDFLKNIDETINIVFIDHNLKSSEGTYILETLKSKNLNPKIIYMSRSLRKVVKVTESYNNIGYVSKNNLSIKDLKRSIFIDN